MNVLSFFHRPRSAPVARERLQLLLAHERNASDGDSDLLEVLRDEILLVIKTTAEVFPRLRDELKILHSYEVPECISVNVEDGLPEYLKWIGESVR